MKNLLKYLMLIVLTICISTAITSCGDDEPDYPDKPDTPVVNPPADDDEPSTPSDDDPAKYDIVGKWKRETSGYVKAVIFEIDRNGFLLCTEILSDETTDVLNGSWTYSANEKKWEIDIPGINYLYEGYYHIVGDKLICGSYIFNKCTEEDDDDPALTGQLAGTTWVNTTYFNDTFVISFNNDGTYYETYGNDSMGPLKYCELADNTVQFGDEYGEFGLLTNTLGYDPIPFELNSNKTKLTLKGDFDTISFTRKR